MAVKFEIDPWCEGCDNLKPIAEHLINNNIAVMTYVRCEHSFRCRQLVERVKRLIEKEKKDEEALR